MKRCPKCGTEKEFEDFSPSKQTKDGRKSWCKSCTAKASRAYYQLNRERILEQNKENQSRKEYQHRWYQDNREAKLKASKDYYYATPEYQKERQRKWISSNREKWNEIAARRRALERSAKIGEVSYEQILERDGLWCYLCQTEVEPDDIHFDHVVPLSKGGEHSMGNIKVTHSLCNIRKGARLVA